MDNSEATDCGCMRRREQAKSEADNVNRSLRPSAISPGLRKKVKIFRNKRALVTGVNKPIGKNIAVHLRYLGAYVIASCQAEVDLDVFRLEHPQIQTLQLDIANWSSMERKLATIGNIDILVNCASTSYLSSILEITEEDCNEMFNVNIKSVINLTKLVARNLITRKAKGSIVSISSQMAHYGLQKHAVFGASKAAVEAFTKTAAIELAPFDIRVNCVNVFVAQSLTIMERQGKEAKPLLAKIPLKRFVETPEVVEAVLFLLSDKAGMITGYSLPVDGGFAAC